MEKMTNINNTLCSIKESFLVVLDSRNASTYNNGTYNSDVTFNFEAPIEKPKHCLIMTCSVLQFTCPNSIYNINETNNKLYLSENNNGPFGIYFQYGNYNVNTFMTAFNTLVGAYSSYFSITFNSLNNKFTINNSNYDFTIMENSTCFYIMGFIKSFRQGSLVKSLTMPYTCNFNGVQSINIIMPCFNTSNIDSYDKSESSIIQPIPIDSTLSQIAYIKTHDYSFKVQQEMIDHIHIRISDDLETAVNLNNQHWNLTLNFTVLLDVNRFHYENTFENILQNGYIN